MRVRLTRLPLLAVLVAGTAGLALLSPTSAGAARAPVTVRLGFFPNVTHAPALVGVDQGIFADALGDNPLEIKTFNAGPEEVTALLAGALDIGYIGPNPSVNAFVQSRGRAVRVVSGAASGGAFLVVKPDIARAKDLVGKTVASPQLGGTQDVALRSWLEDQGIETDAQGGGQVAVVPQENSLTLDAFKQGRIAGAWVPEPWATRLVTEGGGKVLVDEKDLWPDGKFVTTNIIVRTEFLDEHPDVVKRVLRGNLDAIAAIRTDRAAAEASVATQIQKITGKAIAPSLVTASFDSIDFTPDPLPRTLQKSAKDAVRVGLLEPPKRLFTIYDLTLLNRLLAAEGQPPVVVDRVRIPAGTTPTTTTTTSPAAPPTTGPAR